MIYYATLESNSRVWDWDGKHGRRVNGQLKARYLLGDSPLQHAYFMAWLSSLPSSGQEQLGFTSAKPQDYLFYPQKVLEAATAQETPLFVFQPQNSDARGKNPPKREENELSSAQSLIPLPISPLNSGLWRNLLRGEIINHSSVGWVRSSVGMN